MAGEFDRTGERPVVPMPPPLEFPEFGTPESEVLNDLKDCLDQDPYTVEQNFGVSYVGPPHGIVERVRELTNGRFFVEWAREMNPGTDLLEKQAVRMLGSLLGHPDAVGFITSGGTESNLMAMRLARNLAHKENPEVVLPVSAHYSFRLAADLFGLRLREIPVDNTMQPDMAEVEKAINRHTVAMVCSAPEGNFGQLDPIAEFAAIAERRDLYLHVDAAFGGFALPFMRDLGRTIPPFDFSLPGVSSMMTDGHKLGLLPVATGSNPSLCWAVMRHLGREGYRAAIGNLLDVVEIVCEGIEGVDGLRLLARPLIGVVNFTSDAVAAEALHLEMRRRGWGTTYGHSGEMGRIRLSIHPHRDMVHARKFVAALESAVQTLQD